MLASGQTLTCASNTSIKGHPCGVFNASMPPSTGAPGCSLSSKADGSPEQQTSGLACLTRQACHSWQHCAAVRLTRRHTG